VPVISSTQRSTETIFPSKVNLKDLHFSPIFLKNRLPIESSTTTSFTESRLSRTSTISSKSEFSQFEITSTPLLNFPVKSIRATKLSTTLPPKSVLVSEKGQKKHSFFAKLDLVSSQVESPNAFASSTHSETFVTTASSIGRSEIHSKSSLDQSDLKVLQLALLFPGSKVENYLFLSFDKYMLLLLVNQLFNVNITKLKLERKFLIWKEIWRDGESREQ
jgi:hypothetical protein